jgi:hypothetical protein
MFNPCIIIFCVLGNLLELSSCFALLDDFYCIFYVLYSLYFYFVVVYDIISSSF